MNSATATIHQEYLVRMRPRPCRLVGSTSAAPPATPAPPAAGRRRRRGGNCPSVSWCRCGRCSRRWRAASPRRARRSPGSPGRPSPSPAWTRRPAVARSCVALLRRRRLDAAPAAVAVLLPAVALLAVDVAVVAGVDVAAAGPADRRCCRRRPLRLTASPPPLPWVTRVVLPVTLLVTRDVAAHWSPRCDAGRAPAAVDVRALPRRGGRAGARVVGRAPRRARRTGRRPPRRASRCRSAGCSAGATPAPPYGP